MLTLLLATHLLTANSQAPFSAGQVRVSMILGSGTIGTERYVIVGAGGGYYIVDGLELGLEAERWFDGNPGITKLTPQVRYVLPLPPPLIPYVGVFYRHVFIEAPFNDLDAVGGRAGAFYVSDSPVYIGLGAAYERIISQCSNNCGVAYPELLIAVLF